MVKILARVLALAAVAVSVAVTATPAQAATVRQLKTVHNGTCVRPTSKPADLRAQSCSTKPTKARDWEVIVVSSNFNGHPVWQLRNRNTGKCLTRSGSGLGIPSSQSCGLGNNTYWEKFTIKSGSTTQAIVLKSFGAFVIAKKHACLRYEGSYHAANIELATCDTSKTLQRWRP
jgi:hypothetical protein